MFLRYKNINRVKGYLLLYKSNFLRVIKEQFFDLFCGNIEVYDNYAAQAWNL